MTTRIAAAVTIAFCLGMFAGQALYARYQDPGPPVFSNSYPVVSVESHQRFDTISVSCGEPHSWGEWLFYYKQADGK